jgi:hypothetical protein
LHRQTALAVRDSELVKINKFSFFLLLQTHPEVCSFFNKVHSSCSLLCLLLLVVSCFLFRSWPNDCSNPFFNPLFLSLPQRLWQFILRCPFNMLLPSLSSLLTQISTLPIFRNRFRYVACILILFFYLTCGSLISFHFALAARVIASWFCVIGRSESSRSKFGFVYVFFFLLFLIVLNSFHFSSIRN